MHDGWAASRGSSLPGRASISKVSLAAHLSDPLIASGDDGVTINYHYSFVLLNVSTTLIISVLLILLLSYTTIGTLKGKHCPLADIS